MPIRRCPLHTNGDQERLDALADTIEELDDPRIAATTHFYGWWPFSVNIAGGTRYDATVEQDLISNFDRVHATFVERDIPVIIGEWALLTWDHNRPGVIERGEFLMFLEAVGYHARLRNLTTMVWDAGQFLERSTLRWRDQGVYDISGRAGPPAPAPPPAGPANWTTYKEFWQHFQPDYPAGTIILKPEFFAEVTDGTVDLTFHFWSGAKTTYRITKSGTSVTGSPR
ncbi:hypothetical protein AWW66_30380 [Micromonospora rosaria]|uniref:Glycoside hydrolase family 5 domain-containing protein n=1 Tax=Micromonospora rosaria TaxID=47874 RepID=A0A136PIZ4_9ACTN|nr:cellulase family glycosylhydrolase [Micromonospora rosaria]KXK58331.1 hypothetical protein AWW66_30380 [Micromonospora rosaria]